MIKQRSLVGLMLVGTLCGACTNNHYSMPHGMVPFPDAGLDGAPVEAQDCTVLATEQGPTRRDEGACRAETAGGELCLVCEQGYRVCRPAELSCAAVEQGNQICIECRSAGNLISSHCASTAQSCTVESKGDALCLVCRDAAGNILSWVCR